MILLEFSRETRSFVANRTGVELRWRKGMMREIFQWLIEADHFLGPPGS